MNQSQAITRAKLLNRVGRSKWSMIDVLWQPGWEWGLGGEWMHVYLAEFLHCSHETIAIFLIGYTPIQNKKFKV